MRPMADRPVWIGYDLTGPAAKAIAGPSVNAAPLIPGGKFRTIETIRVRGMEFERRPP